MYFNAVENRARNCISSLSCLRCDRATLTNNENCNLFSQTCAPSDRGLHSTYTVHVIHCNSISMTNTRLFCFARAQRRTLQLNTFLLPSFFRLFFRSSNSFWGHRSTATSGFQLLVIFIGWSFFVFFCFFFTAKPNSFEFRAFLSLKPVYLPTSLK